VVHASADQARGVIREWLRNEQRLGIAHWPIQPAAPLEAAAVPTAKSARNPTTAAPPRPPLAAVPRSSSSTAVPPASRDRFRDAATTLPLIAPSHDDDDLPPFCTQELSTTDARGALDALDRASVRSCTRCGLHAGRANTVFGEGNPRPRIAFVGEGPGADEDLAGRPFVGRAGQLLTRMIAAMTLTRDEVYICNVVKCRPPMNRTPTDEEMERCAPFLLRQLAILRPPVIVALGRPAAQMLLQTRTPIGQLRGRFHDFPPPQLRGLPLAPAQVMPTFHPAYLLRSPGEKRKAWDDLKLVMECLGMPIPRSQPRP
jgi:DNA polymerase